MSIASQITKSLQTGQAKANTNALNKAIGAQNDALTDYTNTLTQSTNQANQQLTDTTNKQIEGTRQEVQKQYDVNAINQELQSRQIAEKMANSGLSNSGLNTTQQTALATSRINSDNDTTQNFNNAVQNLRSNLQNAINDNNYALTQNIATQKLNTNTNIASMVKDTAENNANIISSLKSNAQDIRTQLIDSVMSTTDKATNCNTIYTAQTQYKLSDSSVKWLCKKAGIDYKDYKGYTQNKNYFVKKQKKNAIEKATKYVKTSGSKSASCKHIFNTAVKYKLNGDEVEAMLKVAGISVSDYRAWKNDINYFKRNS